MAKAEEPPAAREVRQNVQFTSAPEQQAAAKERLPLPSFFSFVPSYKAQKYSLGFLCVLPGPPPLRQNEEQFEN